MALNHVQKIDDLVSINNVLISTWDKTGLDKFARALADINPRIKIYSTGGTFRVIQNALGTDPAAGNLMQVSDYTGQPEMQGGLVKTLDFKIYLGLLSETYNPAHTADLQRIKAQTIDMVVVNLYPFAKVVAQSDSTPEQARAHIDIGGPCMIRASAKNFLRVAVVSNPGDYERIAGELRATNGKISLRTRYELSKTAFSKTAEYDKNISEYLEKHDFDQVKAGYQFQ